MRIPSHKALREFVIYRDGGKYAMCGSAATLSATTFLLAATAVVTTPATCNASVTHAMRKAGFLEPPSHRKESPYFRLGEDA